MTIPVDAHISRRHFLTTAGLAAAAAVLGPRRLLAEADLLAESRSRAAKAKITVQPLRGNVTALRGSGGNIAVLTGRDGKLLVDAGYSTSRPQITEALAGLSAEPIRHLINTHWHFDHTDGNEWLHSAGAAIMAHANTLKHLSTATRVAAWNYTFQPSPKDALPTAVVGAGRKLQLNGSTLIVKYYGPSHTDGDLYVHFTDADVFHAGDTWWNGLYPFIDYSTGGSINGMIRVAGDTLALVGAKTIIIPGHGPIGDRAAFVEYRDMLTDLRDKVAALKKQGNSLAEVVAAKPSSAYDEKWGGRSMAAAEFLALVYQGV